MILTTATAESAVNAIVSPDSICCKKESLNNEFRPKLSATKTPEIKGGIAKDKLPASWLSETGMP